MNVCPKPSTYWKKYVYVSGWIFLTTGILWTFFKEEIEELHRAIRVFTQKGLHKQHRGLSFYGWSRVQG